MPRQEKQIKAIIVLPEGAHGKRIFEKRICDFYAAQVEQRLHSLPKEQKLEVLDTLLAATYQ